MANTTVEIKGQERLLRRLKRLSSNITNREVLNEIGLYLTTSIKLRVQNRHEDVDGKAFTPYSDKYALWRSKKGYGQAVDLTLTGSMFASLTHHATTSKVTIYFAPGSGKSLSGKKSISNPLKAFYNQERREFFGYTAEDVTRIMNLYQVNIGEVISGR